MSAHEEILTETTTTCKNCETVFEGKFCPNCSQRANTHRFTLKHFGHEVFHAITHADKGMLFLIRKLFRWPGIVAKEYVAGKRKKYFSPLTFLLIMMTLQLYATKKTDFFNAMIDETKKMLAPLMEYSKAQQKKKATVPLNSAQIEGSKTQEADKNVTTNSPDAALEDARKMNPKILENSKLITFIFIPILALLTWLFFYKKSGYNYTENLVLNIFVQGQLSVFFILFLIVPFVLFPSIAGWIFYPYLVLSWFYSLVAYRQFFGQRKRWVFLKGSLAQILYYAIGQQISNFLMPLL